MSRKQFEDPFNGNSITWCSACGYPCEVVRPGKVQCVVCEMDEHINSLEAYLERKELYTEYVDWWNEETKDA